MRCMICNKEMKVVNNFHLKRVHNISIKEYEEMFPNVERYDSDTKKKMSESNRISQIGMKYSEESKRKMSETRKKLIASGKVVTPFMTEDKTGSNNPAWGRSRRSENEIKHTREKNSRIMADIANGVGFKFNYGKFFSEKMDRMFSYRSSYELRFLSILENLDFIITYDYESIRIPYRWDEIDRFYIPDFFAECSDGSKFVVEVGPYTLKVYRDNKTEAKQNAAVEYCLESGFEFVVVTEKNLVDLENMKNSVNCWNDLKPFLHNVIGNDKREGLKRKRIYG